MTDTQRSGTPRAKFLLHFERGLECCERYLTLNKQQRQQKARQNEQKT